MFVSVSYVASLFLTQLWDMHVAELSAALWVRCTQLNDKDIDFVT